MSFNTSQHELDVKPDVTLLGQTVAGLLSADADDTYDDVLPSHAQPEGETSEKKPEKKSKKGSKKVGIKGVKPCAAGSDDSYTMGMLSAGRGQCKMQSGHLTPSLLEEVLNEKKRWLLRSPDVMETLHHLQAEVLEDKEKLTQDQSAKPGYQATGKSASLQKGEPPARSSTSSKSPGPGTKQNQSIWSKEGSAFTSVTSSNT